MTVKGVVLHPRILAQLERADASGTSSREVANALTAPNVLRMFHLITAHALTVLGADNSLLLQLEANFSASRVLRRDLGEALAAKGLDVRVFGHHDNPMFYSLSGTNQAELAQLEELGRDFTENPTWEEVVLCFEMASGIKVTSSFELTAYQIGMFNRVFNPVNTDAVILLQQRGIVRISIVERSAIRIAVERGERILFLPAQALRRDFQSAANFILGALS